MLYCSRTEGSLFLLKITSMKIISFNVNGIRAITGKSFIQDMTALQPDIICLQETKATVEQVKEALLPLGSYHVFANEAERKGYSGTAIITKEKVDKIFFITWTKLNRLYAWDNGRLRTFQHNHGSSFRSAFTT